MSSAQPRRSRRLLTRGLVVCGSALASTAAAWLISSATASADIMPSQPPDSGVIGHLVSDGSSLLSAQHGDGMVPHPDHLAGSAHDAADPVVTPAKHVLDATAVTVRHPKKSLQHTAADARHARHLVQLPESLAGAVRAGAPGFASGAGAGSQAGSNGTVTPPATPTAAQQAGQQRPAPATSAAAPAGQVPRLAPATTGDVQQTRTAGQRLQVSKHTSGSPAQPRAPERRHCDNSPGGVPGAPGSTGQNGGTSGAGNAVATTSESPAIPDAAISLPPVRHMWQRHAEPHHAPGSTPD